MTAAAVCKRCDRPLVKEAHRVGGWLFCPACADLICSTEIPPGYIAAAEQLLDAARHWIASHPGAPMPRFRMPPRELRVAAPLVALGPRLCLNDSARALVAHVLEHEPEGGYSVHMFAAALDVLGYEPERCGLAELGLRVAGMPSSGGRS